MIRVQQVKVPLKHTTEDVKKKCAKMLHLSETDFVEFHIVKQSIDARKKGEIKYVYAVDVKLKQKEDKFLQKIKGVQVSPVSENGYEFPKAGDEPLKNRPVVAGFGPAGIFSAYMLALHGYRPIVFERGKCVEERTDDVLHFWETGILNPKSNVQFGEGGAGAFSDGKLNTLVKDVKGRNHKVLEIFTNAGAPTEILYENKPHIGTDILVDVVTNLRKEILRLGGEIHFSSEITDIFVKDEKIEAIANCNRRSWNVTKRTVKLSMTFINNYPVTITNGTATLLQNTTKHSIRTEQTPTVLTNETGVFSILFDLEANSNLSSGTIKYKFSYNVDGVVKYFYVTINIKL